MDLDYIENYNFFSKFFEFKVNKIRLSAVLVSVESIFIVSYPYNKF